MFLTSIRIRNYRSIVDSEDIRIERLQALVGENGAGKSNILTAINAFLSAGAGGIKEQNFYNINEPIVITSTFTQLTDEERKKIRRYLIGDKLILEKHLTLATDDKTGKTKVSSEYHGYMANPRDWWLSTEGVNGEKGAKPDWKEIAEERGILEYVQTPNGKVNKTSYSKGLERLLLERDDIEYDEPVLGETQALGYATALLAHLPQFYLLPAITDYSDEIDRRSSSTVFRRLMGDLGDRIIKLDPKYKEIEESLEKIKNLLNPTSQADSESGRLKVLEGIEEELKAEIKYLMPAVEKVSLKVEIEGTRELFSRGVQLEIDDGKMTDVLDKGHGLQRCVVFALMKTLIKNERGALLGGAGSQTEKKPIILAIEEPELYIHPQLQRLVYGVLKTFASTTGTHDQVIYSTHSPAFVDVWDYHRIGVVRKQSVEIGTKVHQCEEGVLGTGDEKKNFQLLNSFGIDKNHMFFAKRSILVEGEQDKIAIIATGRSLNLFKEFPEEIEFSIVDTDDKGRMPHFQKVLNAFKLPYTVLLELDGKPETHQSNKNIIDELNGNMCVKIQSKLETLVGRTEHFKSTYEAKVFFSKEENLTAELKQIVKDIFTPTEKGAPAT